MFEIKVASLDMAYNLYDTWGTKMIGLFDPDTRPQKRPHYHVEYFHDVYGKDAERRFGYTAATIEQMKNIFNFAKTFTDDDKVIVHCYAGVSRSTAVAISILCLHGMPVADAVNHINTIRDCMWPNTLLIEYADTLLGLNCDLIREVEKFKENNKQKIYTPFSDAEKEIDANRRKDIMKDLIGKIKW